MTKQEILTHIDHTQLKAFCTWEDIKKLCDEAIKYNTASVCIPPSYIERIKETYGDKINICTVIGFPLGYNTTETKVFEVKDAIAKGCSEVDMVINVGKLKERNLEYVKNDIKAVVEAAKGKALTKVIIETCLLTEEEKIIACKLSKEAGSDFVKTSTGFSTGGATVEDIKLMRETVGPEMGVKASGGVRSKKDALAMIENGATRIGASASISICEGIESNSNY